MATATMSRARKPNVARKVAAVGLDNKTVARASSVFRLMGDGTRLCMLLLLNESGGMHVGAMCERLGLAQPGVSHHIALMRYSELIELRRVGKNNHYRLTDRGREAVKVIRAMVGEG